MDRLVRFAEQDELVPLARQGSQNLSYNNQDALDSSSSSDDDDNNNNNNHHDGQKTEGITPGLNATTRAQGYTKQESMQYHMKAIARDVMESFRGYRNFRSGAESVRSKQRARLNVILGALLAVLASVLLGGVGFWAYRRVYMPIHRHKQLEQAIRKHAQAARERVNQCRGINWEMACDAMGPAGARRRRLSAASLGSDDDDDDIEPSTWKALEDEFLISDDPTITFDENCLRVYRLRLYGNITFPYHASQLLHLGGNATMALFIQHGALRNSEDYFCSFKKLLLQQDYRRHTDVIVVAPDFNYQQDSLVHPQDAFWNSTKPWGDWRVGAESDPACCGNAARDSPMTISSFTVLDTMLAMLTNRGLFPNMQKISYVGHSAGGQMVQRYAIMSPLAALWDLDPEVDLEFIIANPSSYTYLTPQRYRYSCGKCSCNTQNCTCDEGCTPPPYTKLGRPTQKWAGKLYPCYQWNYDRWPYGIGSFSDKRGRHIPYALRDGLLGAERARRIYPMLHVVYMVGQNDTCNDGLPTCDSSCWKRDHWDVDQGENQCFRNHMDTRCPAMLQGPYRRARGHQYMKYLEELYGRPVHKLHTIEGSGHNATAMFGSKIGLEELFGFS